MLDQLQLETRSGSTTETLRAAQRGNRIYITVNNAQGSRGGKEIPGGPGVILLDQQLQALLLLVADQRHHEWISASARCTHAPVSAPILPLDASRVVRAARWWNSLVTSPVTCNSIRMAGSTAWTSRSPG